MKNLTLIIPRFNTGLGILSLWGIATTFSGCSIDPQIQEFPYNANARQELSSLDSDISTARSNQVNVLAPYNYQKANEAFVSANKTITNEKNSKDTLHNIALGNAYLKRAYKLTEQSHRSVESIIEARQKALRAGAEGYFPSDFKKLDDNLKDITSDLESNNMRSIEVSKNSLQSDYLKIQIRAIKKTYLGQTQLTLSEAIKNGARIYAPESLATTEHEFTNAEAFIVGNPHALNEIKERSDKAKILADHLLKITLLSKSAKDESAESLALKMDHKDQIAAQENKELTRLTQTAQSLEMDKKNLLLEASMNEKINNIRGDFSKDEADVYNQQGTLVIRLKGLEFESNHSDLKNSNFPLLTKVQKVVQQFNKNDVIIEGHTDSIGKKETNLFLSQGRAQAVKAYLVKNGSISEEKVKAVGYGYQKPIATNKSKSGRAENRRVDILIDTNNSESL